MPAVNGAASATTAATMLYCKLYTGYRQVTSYYFPMVPMKTYACALQYRLKGKTDKKQLNLLTFQNMFVLMFSF